MATPDWPDTAAQLDTFLADFQGMYDGVTIACNGDGEPLTIGTLRQLRDRARQQAAQIETMAKALQSSALGVTEPARAHAALQAELDEARSLARFLRLELIEEEGRDDIDQTIREVELDLDNDEPLPDWLTGKES